MIGFRKGVIATLAAVVAGCEGRLERIDGVGGMIPPDVQAAFDRTCIDSLCHDAENPAGGFSLVAGESASIVGGRGESGYTLVEIGNVAGSFMAATLLPESLRPAEFADAPNMPATDGDEPAVQRDVALILGWIAGAPLPGEPAADETGTGGDTETTGG